MLLLLSLVVPLLILIPLGVYIYVNDKGISHIPQSVLALTPHRWTSKEIQEAWERQLKTPRSVDGSLPPKTGRRYIVVGGAGFLGGWIVVHLIQRGEDPRNIRIIDIRPPMRRDLLTGPATNAEFFQVDISDRRAVQDAFSAPWPNPSSSSTGTTIFHTAANIRFYERHLSLFHNSTKVNVQGTQNIIDAGREIGADVMVYTSSASIAIRRARFWLWPFWERQPDYYVQVIGDDDALIPKRHEHFFSNYAASKRIGEKIVREANGLLVSKAPSGSTKFKTGCIRPGNGIYGPGGDMLCGAYIVRRVNPTWIQDIVNSFCYVENASLAHLLYEQKLLSQTSKDLSGQAYTVCDNGPAPTNGDVYKLLQELTDGQTVFPKLSPTLMLLLSHIIESYYLIQKLWLPFLPPIKGDIVNLQPSLFPLILVHAIFEDSRARKELGYTGLWNTMEGLCKTVEEHRKLEKDLEERRSRGEVGDKDEDEGRAKMAGISFGFGFVRAQRGVEKVREKVGLEGDLILN